MTDDVHTAIIYDFDVSEDYEADDKEQFVHQIIDGDNESHYGYGFEYNDLEHLFLDGAECFCTCDTRGEIFIVPLRPIRPQRRGLR